MSDDDALQLDQSLWADDALEEDDGPVFKHRPVQDDSEMDITPMIDITFLLLIYFLVAAVPDPDTAVILPTARFGAGVSEHDSVILTIIDGGLDAAPVYIADGKVAEKELPQDPDKQADAIQLAVEQGVLDDKNHVLIKAEKNVAHREVARVAAAASRVEGIRLHLAVLESN